MVKGEERGRCVCVCRGGGGGEDVRGWEMKERGERG